MTNSMIENPYRVISWFLNRNSTNQKGMAWIFKVMKGKILQQSLLYPTRLIQVYQRNQKVSRQAKIKKIKHRKTSFTTNTKGTSLGRHTRERNDLYKTNPKQLRKWFIIVVQLLTHVQLFATPWTAAHQASLSFTIYQILLKLMYIE